MNFTADAIIDPFGRRARHSREDDHDGQEALSVVVLARAIGVRYPAGTTVDVVLADLDARLTALQRAHGFTANAMIESVVDWSLIVRSVIKSTPSGSLTADAVLV